MSDVLDLLIERPVAGGRMLARHEGRVVFVAGAIPGERVRARVERTAKHALFASTVDVIEASPDRREPFCDPACGGLAFAHVRYARQLELKSEILTDAFRRQARHALSAPPAIAASPEMGYRVRARLHVREARFGFFREGSHVVCDAAPTQQLLPAALDAVSAAVSGLGARAREIDAVVVSENIEGNQRAMHFEPMGDAKPPAAPGPTSVSDTAQSLFGEDPPIDAGVTWSRRSTSFFQGNRFLTGALVRRVLALSEGDRCIDLYSGVGLFAVALASRGQKVLAVEGDTSSAQDLALNAAPWHARLRTVQAPVEAAVADAPDPPADVVILDPPRTGVSAPALKHVATWASSRIIYVSCDPPTLARDAAILFERGYELDSVTGFDLFPNTPHVEAVASFRYRRLPR